MINDQTNTMINVSERLWLSSKDQNQGGLDHEGKGVLQNGPLGYAIPSF